MINLFILLFFFIYNISIFFISNYYILLSIFIFNLIISFILKVKPIPHLRFLYHSSILIIFIFLCNYLFSDFHTSIKVSIRLILTLDFTYLINHYLTPSRLRIAFDYLFKPLRLFSIDTSAMTLIITISLSFIPILIDEATAIKYSLKSKGFEPNIKNIIKRPHIYLLTFFNNLFSRLNDLEKTLTIKAY